MPPGKDYLQRDHSVRSGLVRYTSKKPERRDEERGRERWTLIRHADGRRSLWAHSEIDDRPSVLRFVQLNVNPDWTPSDAFVRITVGDEFRGSGWFRFGKRAAECETYTAVDGRVSQRIESAEPIRCFGGHAIQNDAWVTQTVDRSRAGQPQAPTVLLSSTDHRGATGPSIATVVPRVTYLGEERISVAAGVFPAWHFRFTSVAGLPEEHPEYDVWTSTDGDFLFLRGEVGGYMQTGYELAELHDGF